MENQEFDIELLEKKLEEYEQADSNVRSVKGMYRIGI